MNENADIKSTDDVARHRQLEYWNEVISDAFTSLQAAPTQSQFDARIRRAMLANLAVSEVVSSAAQIRHTSSQISRETTPLYLIHLQLKGSSFNQQDGREAILQAGDYTLCDSTRPYELSFKDSNDMLVLRLPAKVLETVLQAPEDLTCVPMSGQLGMSSVASSLLERVWRSYQDSWDQAYCSRIEQILLDTLAVSYADICEQKIPEPTVQHARRVRVVTFIETHLADPQLSPQSIADAFGITSRYLHQIFSAQQETVTQYILRRRLEKANSKLQDKLHRSKTISEIAFSLGFNSLTHFGRVYKDKYGVAPSDAR